MDRGRGDESFKATEADSATTSSTATSGFKMTYTSICSTTMNASSSPLREAEDMDRKLSIRFGGEDAGIISF